MKYLCFCLFVLAVACAPEPSNNGNQKIDTSTDDMSSSIDQSPPYYLGEGCASMKTMQEKKMCGDQKLLAEIDAIILPMAAEVDDISNKKLIYEFDIQTNGKLKNIVVKSAVYKKIDTAVGKYLSQTRWEPARHNGQKVQIRRRLPIYLDGK